MNRKKRQCAPVTAGRLNARESRRESGPARSCGRKEREMEKVTARKVVATAAAALMISTLLLFASAGGAMACGFNSWYLPEGYTGGNFDTYVTIQNPNDWEATANVRFMTDEAVTEPVEYPLGPNSRTTISVDEQPGLADANVSTMVEATSGVVVERAMYFSDGDKRAGGSNSIGANRTSRTWYLAEGYTGGEFDTFILVMNPNPVPLTFKAKFIKPAETAGAGGEVKPQYLVKEYTVDPMRRFTIHVDEIPGLEDTEVSTMVYVPEQGFGAGVETPGVVAERAMYFKYMGVDGGHCSIGAPGPSGTWYLPEGRTAGEYDTYVLVMNPNSTATRVRATFMVPANGAGAGREANPYVPPPDPDPRPAPEPEPVPDRVITKEYLLNPYERHTIALDQIPELQATDVSTMIQSWPAEAAAPSPEGGDSGAGSNPVVAERAMYFARGNAGDGHNSLGAVEKREYWLLAEGYTGGAFDTWILIQNPNGYDVNVKAAFMTPEGDPVYREYEVKQMSRLTIPVDDIEGLEDAEVSTKLKVLGAAQGGRSASCEYGIIAERAMYFEYNGIVGGHCSLGVGE